MTTGTLSSHQASCVAFPRLLLAARRGDRGAQDLLYRRYRERVERIAHAQLQRAKGGRGTALSARFSTADVVQEAFCRLFRKLSCFEGETEGQFINFLTRLVRRRALDVVRFHRSTPRDCRRHASAPDARNPELLAMLPAPLATMSIPFGGDSLESRYRHALASFDPPERDLLQARIEEGLGFTAIADQLGYTSRYAARRAYFAAQARLCLALGATGPGTFEPPARG